MITDKKWTKKEIRTIVKGLTEKLVACGWTRIKDGSLVSRKTKKGLQCRVKVRKK